MITEMDKIGERMKVEKPELYESEGKKHIDLLTRFANDHNTTVMKFGRYPHRNAVLGRESTPEEVEYLKSAETYGQ